MSDLMKRPQLPQQLNRPLLTPTPAPLKHPRHPPGRGSSGQSSSAHRAYGIERSLLGTHIPETIDRMVNANLARGTDDVFLRQYWRGLLRLADASGYGADQ